VSLGVPSNVRPPAAPGRTAAARLLLVEDDAALRGMLARLFTEEGYQVDEAAEGQRGLHFGLTRVYDVIVLDRGLPSLGGLDLLRRWRGRGITTPVLVLSAFGNPSERVEGLDAGAEDYLGKPFDVAELLARLRALLRRHQETASVLRMGTASLDVEARVVRLHGGGEVELSQREADLLAVLAQRLGQVYTREDLLARVFSDAESPTVVDTYVHYCRRKLGKGVIRTVRGTGFRLGEL
jgi:two-component system response regulator QseB